MSDKSSPQEPADEARPVVPGPGRRFLMVVLIAMVGVFTVNVWLAFKLLQQRTSDREHAFWVLCQPGHTLTERQAAFRDLIASGNKEWRAAVLSDLNLEGVWLNGQQFDRALFLRANFSKANLMSIHINKGSFELGNLTQADLSKSDLSETQFYRANLKDARLREVSLRAAGMQEVNANNTDFFAADMAEADCLMADFTGANLNATDLSSARLEAAIFKGANLSLAKLSGANLKDADFSDCNWWRAAGLTSSQIATMKKRFAPSEKADAALKEDYQKWLSHVTE